MLHFSDHSWLETGRGCSIPVKKMSGGYTTWVGSGQLSTCAESRLITATGKSVAWLHNLMRAEVHPTQEAFIYFPWDRCLYIYICIHSLHPTQEAFWYLPWDSCLVFSLTHSSPHSKSNTVSCVEALSLFTLVVTVNYSGLKPTRVHSRVNSVNCHEPFTLIQLYLNILLRFNLFVISYNILLIINSCLLIDHLVAMPFIHLIASRVWNFMRSFIIY